MEKKTKSTTKKPTKKVVKKPTTKKESKSNTKKKKGFTLIELLAVIIILGILMIIAIPSVTSYINDSRKNAYIDTAREIVSGTRNIVNEGRLGMYDTNTTYYIPAKYVNTENSLKSPYGEFTDESAYVGVIYDGKGYKYYWISSDDAGQGIPDVTLVDKLDTDLIKSDLNPNDILDIVKTTGIGDRTDIKILKMDGTWDNYSAENNVSEDGEKPNSYYLYYNTDNIINSTASLVPTNEYPGEYHVDVIYNDRNVSTIFNGFYDNYLEAMNSTHYFKNPNVSYGMFIRIKIENDKVVQGDLGYELNNKIYYLKANDPDAYQTNKSILLNSFGSENCNSFSIGNNTEQTNCFIESNDNYPGLEINVSSQGSVNAYDGYDGECWSCNMYYNLWRCLQPF